MTDPEAVAPEPRRLRVILLTDAIHLDLAREVVRAGDPGLAMDFVSGDADGASFTVNDVPHQVQYLARPLNEDTLWRAIVPNVIWNMRSEPHPNHDAMVIIERDLGDHKLPALLALTDVIHALARKIPAHAIVWSPFAASPVTFFNERYEALYAGGKLPVSLWIQFAEVPVDGKRMILTFGLEELGLYELEFEVTNDHFALQMTVADILMSRMIARNEIIKDNSSDRFSGVSHEISVKISHRSSLRKKWGPVCFLDFTVDQGGQPAKGVH